MATLQLKNITKRFGKDVVAVKNLSLEVHDGEYLVLLGPSGCGKTTTMRMIAGLEEATHGTIILDGVDITDLPPRKRDVSMVFQSYAIWPHMTVYENIAFALKLRKMPAAKIEQIVKEVTGLTKISQLLERYPAQLSGGQRQRVAVARAIAVKPKIFLMDEPLSNLDAKLRDSTRTELKAIHNQTGATTVFVTHDQAEAMSIADRIVIMDQGEIVQSGTPEEVYSESNCLFVADFIGTPPTNLIDAKLVAKQGTYYLENSYLHMPLSAEHAQRLREHGKQDLVLGIRPEDIKLGPEEGSLFSTECLVAEPQGSHQIVAVDVVDKLLKIMTSPRPQIASGEKINLTFTESALRFFDPETGKRI
ncbi:MAG: ABC transporter ATP-binding protein [Chloroflexota bacterium]|nr:ABC transporter ATP-binding protein [Chloroflexota bacterium]